MRESAPPWLGKPKPTKKKGAVPDPIPVEVREVVRKRSGDYCELCLDAYGDQLHHRQSRRGGDHSVPNLVHLCATCHRKVHSHPAWSNRDGWIVPMHAQAAVTPLLTPDGGWVRLGEHGGRFVCADPEGEAL